MVSPEETTTEPRFSAPTPEGAVVQLEGAAQPLARAADAAALEGAAVLEAGGLDVPPPAEAPAVDQGKLPGSPVSAAPGALEARPSYVFFGAVAGASLFLDIGTKVWAEVTINERGFEPLNLIGENLSITLAYNRGGAWGLLATASEVVRRPFFLTVSFVAILFIVSLYSKLTLKQRALSWGLPLVLGGALGNLSDRITRSQVVDFIDYRADWILGMNAFVSRYVNGWTITDHWPTFNVADIAICVGVGLMAIDMFSHRPRHSEGPSEASPGGPEAQPAG